MEVGDLAVAWGLARRSPGGLTVDLERMRRRFRASPPRVDLVVGHLAHLEGCTLEDGSLAGSCSVILHWAVIGKGATVGANAVVPNNGVVPPGALALGVPAKLLEGRSDVDMIAASAVQYVENAKRYRTSLRRVD